MVNFTKKAGLIVLGYLAALLVKELFNIESTTIYLLGLLAFCLYLASKVDDLESEITYLQDQLSEFEEENKMEIKILNRTTNRLTKELNELNVKND